MPERHVLTIPLLIGIHIFTGISTAGITLAQGNIGLKLAPRGEATAYLASISVVNSVMAGIAPLIGGALADYLSKYELSMILKWKTPLREILIPTLYIEGWDFFFLFAFLIGMYSTYRLSRVTEEGEVRDRVVIDALVSEVIKNMRNLSTAGGLYQVFFSPVTLLGHPLRRLLKRINDTRENNGRHKGGGP
jgi:hypothetical protein